MKSANTPRRFEHHFRTMGTDAGLWVWNDNEQRARNAFASIEKLFARAEARLSRFLADSELSRLNRSAGQPFQASAMLYGLVEDALAWRGRTGGIFDPTILNALVAYGYDRPFAAMQAGSLRQDESPEGQTAGGHLPVYASGAGPAEIEMGANRMIRLPAGVGIDLGGIAKGWTVQQAAHRLGMWGPCLVDAGGDIACTGAPPAGPWVVSVADPQQPDGDIGVLTLNNEAVATSSRTGRKWLRQGEPAHHLIDPRTGAPADTGILSVTVIAPRLPDAEIHAKVALILGERPGLAYLSDLPGVAAILVTDDGRQLACGPLEDKVYVSPGAFADRFRTPA